MRLMLCIGFSFVETRMHDDLILFPVDKDTALPTDYEPMHLIDARSHMLPTTKEGISVHIGLLDDLISLMNAAQRNGISLTITSGYRSYDRQEALFHSLKQKNIKKGLSASEAEKETSLYCAYPGHSEHQLGTALDIIADGQKTLKHTAENKRAWQWLAAHAEEYGFVLSYPEGKTECTGYAYEPWHFRWIGKKYAGQLKEKHYKDANNSITSTSYLKTLAKQD